MGNGRYPLEPEDIESMFGFHPATDETRPQHQNVRRIFTDLAQNLNEDLPEGREKALALTNLQQAAMWSNCAIAMTAPFVPETPEDDE